MTMKPSHVESPSPTTIKHNRVVFCSFDIETGGEDCGILQMSGELFRPNPVDPTGSDFVRIDETFNQYVKPPPGAIFNVRSCQLSHGLTAQSDCIKSANPFRNVWADFCEFISRHISINETFILVAYNGATCDLRWIWKYLQAPRTTISMPDCIKFFLDPL